MTQEFVEQLLDTFRDQKKLHRKYAYQVMFCKKAFPDIKQLHVYLASIESSVHLDCRIVETPCFPKFPCFATDKLLIIFSFQHIFLLYITLYQTSPNFYMFAVYVF